MAQWTRWWWCLIVVTADASLASGVEECFLYPVTKGEKSPNVPLNASGDTIITINNIYDNNTITNITTNNGVCVARVLHKSTYKPKEDGCPVLNASAVDTSTGAKQEVVTVVVRRGGGRTSVYLRDSGDHDHQVKVNLSDASSLHVVSQEFVNVGYGCYDGCFQFQNATIHKNFRDGRHGSLLFYGRLTGSGPPKGTIFALRDATWNQRRGFYPKDSIMNNTHWFAFRALPEYIYNNSKCVLSLTLRYKTAASSCSPEDPACNTGHNATYTGEVPSKDLYLTFYATENVRWAVFCRPRATSQVPGVLKWLSEKTIENWVVVALGGCSVLLLVVSLVLGAALHRRRSPPPPALTTSPSLNDVDDPSGHIYEYVDLDTLKQQLAEDKSASQMDLGVQKNKRNSHTSVNSLYGCLHPPETTTQ
ncbi:uncharacterized protein [Procambarus clarkii]|uniref:uncharacterized protein isoform X2 n=1 Tax=Procambarus clarkii TaxID=6728 RepID=UPI00374217BD